MTTRDDKPVHLAYDKYRTRLADDMKAIAKCHDLQRNDDRQIQSPQLFRLTRAHDHQGQQGADGYVDAH